jgi:hypothetical protein
MITPSTRSATPLTVEPSRCCNPVSNAATGPIWTGSAPYTRSPNCSSQSPVQVVPTGGGVDDAETPVLVADVAMRRDYKARKGFSRSRFVVVLTEAATEYQADIASDGHGNCDGDCECG